MENPYRPCDSSSSPRPRPGLCVILDDSHLLGACHCNRAIIYMDNSYRSFYYSFSPRSRRRLGLLGPRDALLRDARVEDGPLASVRAPRTLLLCRGLYGGLYEALSTEVLFSQVQDAVPLLILLPMRTGVDLGLGRIVALYHIH